MLLEIDKIKVRGYLAIEKLKLAAGSYTAVCGPNGAGKSTLISALAGYLKLDSGEISLNQKPLSHYSVAELARLRCWLSQKPASVAHFSVQQKLMQVAEHWLPAFHQGQLRRQLVDELLTTLDLIAKANAPLWQLSGGELQRCYLAATLLGAESLANPDNLLILLDEPLAGLDLHHQQSVMHWLRRYTQQGAAVVLSLHDLNLALVHHLNLWLLDKGRLHSAGPAEAVLTPDNLQQVYGVAMRQVMVNDAPQLVFV